MTRADDPWDLDRFLLAQASSYDRALQELRQGAKRSHWMWYVFPQIAGLGHSEMAIRYAIQGIDEAEAYLRHPVLGVRLKECTEALLSVEGRSAREIMVPPDDLKLRSSATLFDVVSPGTEFARLLATYFDGVPDEATLRLLQRS